MITSLHCIPCFIHQAFKAVSRLGKDDMALEKVLRSVLAHLSTMDLSKSPPEIAEKVYAVISEHTGVADPYCNEKKIVNALAAGIAGPLMAKHAGDPDQFLTRLRMVIAANIIDFGVHDEVSGERILSSFEQCMAAELDMPVVEKLRANIASANSILYLGDNAGEIVFDKLFIEAFTTNATITYAVRGKPIINDVTMHDAQETGIDRVAQVISNGAGVPGTVLELCTPRFRRQFEQADLIISKGQGNFETLNCVDANIFFLLQVKCEVVARDLGLPLGAFVIYKPEISVQMKDAAPESAGT
ncbi:MAG: DUF89 family protein [Chitinivibrionales bacterium]|nr:DUF89 family protein [Chitinivibrionales bacterium]